MTSWNMNEKRQKEQKKKILVNAAWVFFIVSSAVLAFVLIGFNINNSLKLRTFGLPKAYEIVHNACLGNKYEALPESSKRILFFPDRMRPSNGIAAQNISRSLFAKDMESLRYAVCLDDGRDEVGQCHYREQYSSPDYTNPQKGIVTLSRSRLYIDVRVIDLVKKQIVGQRTFYGSDPPADCPTSIGERRLSDFTGSYPDMDNVSAWLRLLKSSLQTRSS